MAERDDKEFDVFLVHSSDNKSAAIQIKHALTDRGLKTYAHYDEGSTFGIGQPTVISIMKAVNMSNTVLILLTANAVKSQWVSFEILLALERSLREGSMCCRLCMVGISEEERRQYQTGELVHIPSVIVDFDREGWADQLYASIIEEKRMEQILPSGNVAVGLVFNYFVGFLRQILPNSVKDISVQEFIGEAVMTESMMSMDLPKSPLIHRRVSPNSPRLGREEEYFASITHTELPADQFTSDQVMSYLEKQGKRFTNCDANKLHFEVLDKSRWNIFVFSKEALADGTFKLQFDAAINSSIRDDQMQVIPVLSKRLKLEDVPSFYKWVTLLSADEPRYIEKLWKVMNSPPAKMTEKIPAGQVYKGLAWAYLLNYLPLALLGKTAEDKNFRERFDDAMIKYKMDCPYFAKVFINIPTSCSFPPPGSQFPGEEHIDSLEPVVLGFRNFFLQLYRITTSKGKVVQN